VSSAFARALKISEATVKRIFATKNCTLERLDEICELLQVDLAELARGAPRDDKLINRLTPEQEQELMAEPALLLVAICAIQQMRVDEMVGLYDLDEAQCVKLLLRLERIGILEVHENNRIRLRLARTFAWNSDGPIMRMVTVRVSGEARIALLRRVEQVAREYDEQLGADARLPLEQRYPLSVLLAVRYWEPALFKTLRRSRKNSGTEP